MANQQELQTRIGDAIRVYARVRKITLKSLAEALDMSKASFFERLRGATAMSITELAEIARLLDVGVADLLEPPEWVAGESNPEPADPGLLVSHAEPEPVKPGQSRRSARRSEKAA